MRLTLPRYSGRALLWSAFLTMTGASVNDFDLYRVVHREAALRVPATYSPGAFWTAVVRTTPMTKFGPRSSSACMAPTAKNLRLGW